VSRLPPVSEDSERDSIGDGSAQATVPGEDASPLPALVEPAAIVSPVAAAPRLPERSHGSALPAVQAAAVAAGGFVAGAAVVGLVHRRQRRGGALGKGRRAGRSLASSQRSGAKAGELLQIVGSRSLLVDVHLLGGRGGDR
jgi:hypothetical protein